MTGQNPAKSSEKGKSSKDLEKRQHNSTYDVLCIIIKANKYWSIRISGAIITVKFQGIKFIRNKSILVFL